MPLLPPAATDSCPSIAVVGAGAVGCYYGGMLARAGAAVTLIGRSLHMDAIARDGLLLERVAGEERIRMGATTDPAAVGAAELVLVCVKSVDTVVTAQQIAPLLRPHAIVLSMQNGVDNVERIYAATGIKALAAAVYGAAAMAGPGHIRHSGRGDLIIGELPKVPSELTAGDLDALAALLERADIPCLVAPDIRLSLWQKMTMNCAYNAISALARSRYGTMTRSAAIVELMMQALTETVAVAQAEGVALDREATIAAAMGLGQSIKDATSSTAQDIARGKPTEIDSLNGYVARRGAELGVDTPINKALHALVKLLESADRL